MPQPYLPAFYLPFPEQAGHPQSDEVEAGAYAWARDRELVDEAGYRRLVASRIVTAGTGYYDRGALVEMGIVARWYVWILLADDYFDDTPVQGGLAAWERRTGEFVDDLAAALDGHRIQAGERHGPLFAAVVEDLWPRTAERMPDAWRRRFADHLRDCVTAFRWQATVRHGELPVPTIAEYLTRRRFSFGSYIFYDLIEMVDSLSLPEAFYAGRTWHQLMATTTDAMAWTNDIFSLSKDLADGECANLVILIHAQNRGSWEECVDEVNMMVSERLRHFLYARADLPYEIRNLGLGDGALAQADLLAARLGGAVRASLDLHRRSARWAADAPALEMAMARGGQPANTGAGNPSPASGTTRRGPAGSASPGGGAAVT